MNLDVFADVVQVRRKQDHHAQVLHLPDLHGPAAALSRTHQVLHFKLIYRTFSFIICVN